MSTDVEQLITDVQTYLTTNLNTSIGALNTEKSDSITLATVDSSAYFFQTLNDSIANYNPFVFVSLDDMQSVSEGGFTLKTLTMSVVIVVSDRGQDLQIGFRMLRYSRVLEELFGRGWAKIRQDARFKVTSLVPVSFKFINSADPYRAVGVELVTQLG